MSILIGKYEFDGPYKSVCDLAEKRGLYAVLHNEGDEYELIHVAQAENIRECIELSQLSYSPTSETVLLAACYTPEHGTRERRLMIDDIHKEFDEQENQELNNQPLANTAL